MENFLISLNTVLPLFLVIGMGCLARRLNLISAGAVREANSLCFKLFMSTLLFYNIYTSDLNSSFNVPLLAFSIGGVLVEFLIGLILIPRLEQTPPARGVMLQAFFRTNVILLGIPIASSLFGSENIGQVSVILAFVVPALNVLAVIALEMYRDGRPNPKKILKGVATNPLVIAAVIAISMVLLGIRLPFVLESAVGSIANAATPLALILMGASLNFSRFKSSARNLIVCVSERLVIVPILFVSLAAAMGFRGLSLCTVMLLFGGPVAVNSYTMAMQMDGDTDLAGGIVLFTTGLSCLTLFVWIWLLKSLGLF